MPEIVIEEQSSSTKQPDKKKSAVTKSSHPQKADSEVDTLLRVQDQSETDFNLTVDGGSILGSNQQPIGA